MAPASRDHSPYVGGKRRDTDRTTGITDRTTGDEFDSVAVTDEATAEAAAATADDAMAAMRESTLPQRSAWCRQVADGIRERREELTDTLVRVAGKPVASARAEVDGAADRFDHVAAELHEVSGEYRTWTSPDRSEWNTLVKAAPLGVTVCRPSADSPLGTAALQVAPAIGAGNSVVLQPAKTTPVTASILTDIVAESDVPAAGFAFVPEPTSVATESLTAHEAVAAILQSGPDRAVDQTETAQGTVRLRMTLGGTAPAVVLDDADIEAAAEAIANGGARRRGYRSPGTPSVLAHEAVSDELVTRLDTHLAQWHRGDLFDEATTVGPLVDRERATRVAELVTDAVDRGGRLVRGGDADGRAFEPTLLADVPRDAKVHHERTGPVVAVTAVDSQDAAAAVLNGTARSRAPSVFTDSYDRAMTFADAVETRAVRINAAPDRGPQGGVLGTTVSNSHGLHETLACLTRRKRVIH